MFCEPNYYLPQEFDLNALRESHQPPAAKVKTEELKTQVDKKKLKEVKIEYNIVPLFSQQRYPRKVLSLKHNAYLLDQWHKYLDNVPPNYVTIFLYVDCLKKPTQPRKIQLNGQFYGVDNKLAPIPYLPDPRQYDKVSASERNQRKSK